MDGIEIWIHQCARTKARTRIRSAQLPMPSALASEGWPPSLFPHGRDSNGLSSPHRHYAAELPSPSAEVLCVESFTLFQRFGILENLQRPLNRPLHLNDWGFQRIHHVH